MKKLTVLSLIFALALFFGSCSVLQKNGKSSEKSMKEQPQDIKDTYEDTNDDW